MHTDSAIEYFQIKTDKSQNENYNALKNIEFEKKNQKNQDSLYLYFSVCTASLLSFSGGVGTTWTSAVIPKLKSSRHPLNNPVTTIQISLIASLYDLGQIVGPHIFMYIFEKYDRKNALFWINMVFVIGNIILGLASKVEWFYFARFIMGVAFGGSAAVTPIYISEITEDHNRGKFICLYIVFINLGFLYSFLIGPFLHVNAFNFLCIVPTFIFFILWKFLPESPYQLVKQRKMGRALKTLKKLRKNSGKDLRKLDQLFDKPGVANTPIIKLFQLKLFQKTFFAAFGFMIGVPLSGVLTVLAFSQEIFIESGTFIASEYSSIIIGFWVTLVTFVITYYIMERFGRKSLMLFGSFGATICLFFISMFFFLKKHLPESTKYTFWMPLIFTALYLACFQCYGAIIWTVLTEIFPPDGKTFAMGIVSSIFLLGMSLSAFCFPIICKNWGMTQVFFLHDIFSLLAFIHIYFFVPETKNKSYDEIRMYFLCDDVEASKNNLKHNNNESIVTDKEAS